MDISVILGLLIGGLSLIFAFILEGGHLGALLGGSAALIVFGGTLGAVIVAFPMAQIKKLPKVIGVLFRGKNNNFGQVISYLKDLSINSRKNGLLGLEKELSESNISLDSFGKKALQMVIDGADSSVIRNTMEIRIETMDERHRKQASVFESAGGFAPTMGIIGTVTGLIHVLGNLEDPNSLGPKIALAFIATLYGVASANLLWLPMANKLKVLNDIEVDEKRMILEGIILIQEGANPTTLVNALESFMTEEESKKINSN
ncbi:flagellar motor protein [Clostridium hydrogeniformans]|uniref:flagellar motor protein n=1 Tax=Clostridium hydrogeniformans TaxID=349933 RepID=UPI000482A629|nr:flagellar motor protein [Clostridium hydrogeniformans]